MDGRIYDLVDALEILAESQSSGSDRFNIIKKSNPITGSSVKFAVCKEEPASLVLPLNVYWVVTDDASDNFHKVLQRVSKDASEGHLHTWEVVNDYDSLWKEDQYYAPEDQSAAGEFLSGATTSKYGTATISKDAADPEQPVFVSANDPRNKDKRYPLEHDHAEKPAVQLIPKDTPVTINRGVPEQGAVLKSNSATAADQKQLTLGDLEAVTVAAPTTIDLMLTDAPRYMKVAGTQDILVTVWGKNVPKSNRTFTPTVASSDESVISVAGNTITAAAKGTASLTISLADAGGTISDVTVLVIVEE